MANLDDELRYIPLWIDQEFTAPTERRSPGHAKDSRMLRDAISTTSAAQMP